MRCAFFDIDNTLFDTRERFYTAIRQFGVESPSLLPPELRMEFWKAYMDPSLLNLDRPIPRAIEMAIDAKARGLRLVIVTGRYEWIREETILQLKMAGVPFDELLMRPPGFDAPDRELKPALISKAGCEPFEYHDDDLEALLRVRELYPNAILFLHSPDGRFEIIHPRAEI